MRSQLRKKIRKLRRELTETQQKQASSALLSQIKNIPDVFSYNTYAVYLASDGEIDTMPLIEELSSCGAEIYLPVVDPDLPRAMTFRRYDNDTVLVPNKYGILEPDENSPLIQSDDLDVIFAPLVAFDLKGNRLGMGGGYYDQLFKNLRQSGREVKIIGLAHDFQLVDSVPADSWDEKLETVTTPAGIYLIAP
jgi:5-formyltetrahydrofolate cyclo-ligase